MDLKWIFDLVVVVMTCFNVFALEGVDFQRVG